MKNGLHIDLSGSEFWFKNGERHRENDSPAIIYADGSKHWYRNGERHRDDQPAVIDIDGTKEWWKNGERHREDGPAIIYADGTEWWLNGVEVTITEVFNKSEDIFKILEYGG